MIPKSFELLERIRHHRSVVHHITNWVTIYDCAQVVKTLGASPVMAHAPEEAAEMAAIASALVLNIGTLTADLVEAMKLAARSANVKRIPVILDVCGAGATGLRNQKCRELLDAVRIDVIKGNASEIASVSGQDVKTRGVDSGEVGADLEAAARRLASARKAVVVATGAEDIVTNGVRTWRVGNGHVMLTRVVGTGCMAASVIGTFAAVEPDAGVAAASALACYGIAAELAAAKAAGPAAFKTSLFDALFALNRQEIAAMEKITES